MHAFRSVPPRQAWQRPHAAQSALYTPQQRARRDATRWTLVQGVLAPVQFVACAISTVLLLRFLVSGEGQLAAEVSFAVKCALLGSIMFTGSIWEKRVFGRWLFAPAFFWEDVVSMLVIALHLIVLVAMFTPWLQGVLSPRGTTVLALVAYAAYIVNAAQFLIKLRRARVDEARNRLATAAAQPLDLRAREAGL